MKTIAIIIQRGLGVQGPGPDFAHLEGTVAVDVAFGYALVLEGRAALADPAELPAVHAELRRRKDGT